MNFSKILIILLWLGLGLGILGLSLVHVQRRALLASLKHPKNISSSSFDQSKSIVIPEAVNQLSSNATLPGQWNYPFKVVQNWFWWHLADSKQETQNRLLFLANDRLKSGWILFQSGNVYSSVETLTKAEHYLNQAFLLKNSHSKILNKQNLVETATIHHQLLSNLEPLFPEETRPWITELLNISQNILANKD